MGRLLLAPLFCTAFPTPAPHDHSVTPMGHACMLVPSSAPRVWMAHGKHSHREGTLPDRTHAL
jgi:hypothetical protein